MNKILKNYCQHWRWAERFGAMFVTRPTFTEIIACCPEEKLLKIAKTSGSTGAKDALRTMGIAPTYNQVLHFIENNMGKFGNWFDYNQHIRGKNEIIHLRHEMGPKWSLFIEKQVSTIFQSILNENVKTEIFDNAVTIGLTK
jgi:hypothetical protein